MQDEKTGGTDDEKTGGDDGSGGGGGAADPLSRRAFLDELAGVRMKEMAPEEGELSAEQQREIRYATREFIEDVESEFDDMLPEGTRSQKQEYSRAALEGDHGKMIKITLDAHKVSEEKEDQDRRENSNDLPVSRGGSGAGGEENKRPGSLRQAMAQAARGVRGN